MRDGAIVQSADPRTLYRDPLDAELACFLGDAVLLAGELGQEGAHTALGQLRTRGARAAGERRATVTPRLEGIAPVLAAGAGAGSLVDGHHDTSRSDPVCTS
jgi:iron(III) transport system ATP-binding protein